MDSIGNVNHAVSVFGELIFYSSYEKSLPLNIDLLYLVCACSDEEYYFVKFIISVLCSEIWKSKMKNKLCVEVIQYSYEYLYIYDRIVVAITR